VDHLAQYVGGLTGPSPVPERLGTPARLFGGSRPVRHFVAPVGRFQDQRDRNACNPHAHARPIENVALANGVLLQVSRADLYSGALFLDGSEGRDVGTTMAACARWLNTKGVLSEYDRPYRTDDVTRRTNPALDARRARGVRVSRLPLSVEALQDALLVTGGVPYGQVVRDNYKPDARGVLPLPDGSPLRGYHATCLEGYADDAPGGLAFLMANSWAGWGIDHPLAEADARFAHLRGKRGYCWVPAGWFRDPFTFEPALVEGVVEVE